MIISTKGRYGLRAMFELAKNHKNGPVSIKHIATVQEISEQYLEQIFSKLKGGGLIRSVRGAQGGYELNKDLKDLTVGDILRTLEGPLAPAGCVIEQEDACENVAHCTTYIIWKRIFDGINKVVDSISLQDMLDDFKENKKNRVVKC